MKANSGTADELTTLKSHFLATLSYEIRTPLTGILGMLDLMLETGLTEEQMEYAECSRHCAESLLQTMSSALDYAALAAGQVTLEESEFALRDLFDTMLDGFSRKARAKGLQFIRSLDPDLPEVVYADAVRLKQMAANLIDNAIKFTNRGEVEVAVSAITLNDGETLLSIGVRDTGIGIPAQQVQSIFDSFQQLDGGFAKRYSGIGLGLAVTQKLTKLMEAELTVSSVEGEGSTFAVNVPMRVRDYRFRHWNTTPEPRLSEPRSATRQHTRFTPVSAA